MHKQLLYLDGAWVAGSGIKSVLDRWTGEEIGCVAVATAEHASRAVETLGWAAEEARRIQGETVALDAVEAGANTLALIVAEPRGIVAAITPFNFPLNLVLHKIAPALAAGCAVVLKPSNKAVLVAGLLVEIFEKSGLPAGWLNLVTGPAAVVADAWIADRGVAVITYHRIEPGRLGSEGPLPSQTARARTRFEHGDGRHGRRRPGASDRGRRNGRAVQLGPSVCLPPAHLRHARCRGAFRDRARRARRIRLLR